MGHVTLEGVWDVALQSLHGILRTHFLTPWSTVLLEKLTGSQLVKKIPTFYGTRRFITAFTSARHLSLSGARSIQSVPSHPNYCGSILISSHLRLRLPSGLFSSGFPTEILVLEVNRRRWEDPSPGRNAVAS
jgi:hypothetical protein